MFVLVAGLPVLLAGNDGSGPVAVLLLLPLGLVALHPGVLGRIIALAERLSRRSIDIVVPTWRQSVGLVARYVPSWLAIGLATWAVPRRLRPAAGSPGGGDRESGGEGRSRS